jgi:DNA-binding NarL/FixJ family response regulator
MRKTIRIVVADDQQLVRQGICGLLALEPDFKVVGDAADGETALALIERLHPDIVLLDLLMPGKPGLETLAAIVQRHPATRVIVLTAMAEPDVIFWALQVGATGYLLKTISPRELIQAIHLAHEDGMPLDPQTAAVLVRRINKPPAPPAHKLTKREQEILACIAQGATNQELAERFGISGHTVRAHVTRVFKKLGVNSRVQAALYFLKELQPQQPKRWG